VTSRDRLLSTAEAARAIGVARTTLFRWWRDGKVAPELVTMGGHARWDLDDLRRQMREWAERERAERDD
jgi:predicted site-specific integrase-resolvase